MNKVFVMAACFAGVVMIAVGTAAQVTGSHTISRLQAKINERKIVSREMVVIDGVTNTVTHYSQAGVEWTETNVARVVTGVLAPVRYSTLKLLSAVADTGRYSDVKAALQTATTPNGMPFWDALLAAQYLLAEDPRLVAGIELAVTSGLCTSNEIANILKKAED